MSQPALETFRAEVRGWLEANCPQSMRTPMPEDEIVWGGRNVQFKHADQKSWLDAMAAKGWTAPTWPKELGGGGLSRGSTESFKVNSVELMPAPRSVASD